MSAPVDYPSTRNSVPGARPEGAEDEREAAAHVREMFGRIVPRYDFLNHLLSFSLDRVWRRRTAHRFRHVLVRRGARVLDLCCGTGDLAVALRRKAGPSGARILGADFVHEMLVHARRKALPRAAALYVEADALSLPFADASFDLVTAAFGFRNLANYRRGLEEIRRVLRPGGEVGILEFSEPRGALIGPLYRFYFTQILPRVGGAISGNAEAYFYLPSSVVKFPLEEELVELMRVVGFDDAAYQSWTGGIVALHTARRP
jgi:demethylmenaquinone methyltransferase/2-methoxy-6-polyprenyl-1,4-benzoquinol methylase